ncbi:phosphoglycolate phosphatase [Pseudomonas duriflava]|uniref:Phosphoglycolate phosphatase n=1 Tax=Pseudomonas duriflava TaxID=459528 RepID=A0A562QLC9_9PSED|nr:HAD family hydrolase [Pseudomonas duriflava]TWI57557.1 phosphoglycolate phosphatase [Pseudomonas duriflava]
MHYSHLLFDLDGTLTDPKLGITRSIQYALAQMGVDEPNLDNLIHFIGPPLHGAFMETYGFTSEEAWQAIEHYRERFREEGLYENFPYPGIHELLAELQATERKLYVVTSKPWIYANEILRHFELTGYFKAVYGSELDGTHSDKADLIGHVLETEQLAAETCLMIGDRKHDLIGARHNSVEAAGVCYGYGGRAELDAEAPAYVFETLEDLRAAFM